MEEEEEAAPVSLGSGLSFVPGWDFWPSVLSVGTEPACIKTLGVVGTGVGAGCLAPRDGSQDPLGSMPHAVQCPCPPCSRWPRGGNCQRGAALHRNHLKLELCRKYFHPSAGKNSGPWPAGHSGGVATAEARCHLAAGALCPAVTLAAPFASVPRVGTLWQSRM